MTKSADEEVGFVTEQTDGVLAVTFNRPAFGNALPAASVPRLTALFRSLGQDKSVRVLLFRGEGKTFSSGGDIRGFRKTLEATPEARRENFHARLDLVAALVDSFMALDLPVVAACQGGIAGAALAYALGADVVLADETVNFSFAHQRVGLPPDAGVSVLLPRAVGERKALELILTAANVKAEEALRIGLVSRIIPAEHLQSEALKVAQQFARAPQNVIRTAKNLVRAAPRRTLKEQLAAERDAIADAVTQPDFEEGIRAFLEKRPACFPSAADIGCK